jgi:DNA-directed RNA polymerase specialized sigma24 family protein
VFLRGWEAYQKSLEPIGNPSAFLYQIARNTVIDHYRDKGKAQFVSTDSVPHIVIDPRKYFAKINANFCINLSKIWLNIFH